ncbi:MAG: hypothetical protein JWM74_4924 [Myxococcaceae bacterium]|nr:hypothetical protein [Myxococcaceae bacterium]
MHADRLGVVRLFAAIAVTLSSAVAHAAGPASPATDLVLVADPELGMEGGVRSVDSVIRVVLRYDEVMPTFIRLDEKRPNEKVAAVVARLLQTAAIDFPIAELLSTFTHEVYGHGARGREFGRAPVYSFSLPASYSWLLAPDDHSSHSGTTDFTSGRGGQVDQALPGNFGGIEANLTASHWMTTRIVANDGNAHHGELLAYMAKTVYADSVYGHKIDRLGGTDAGNDVSNYVTNLQDRFNRVSAADRVSIASHLRTAYAWNLLDPTLLFAAWSTVRFVALGDRASTLPMPRAYGIAMYPSTRFALSPFGAEHYLDLFFAKNGVVANVYGRAGSSGLATYDGLGVRVLGWEPLPGRLGLGGELDVWTQPETLLVERNVYERTQILGANVAAHATLYLGERFGITGKLALKSRGYLMSEPIAGGPYGYLGIAVRAF